MKKDIKICIPVYKLLYSLLFFVILSLVRGITTLDEIGGAMDVCAALLAVVFCAETYVMERSAGRLEVFALFPPENRNKMVWHRLLIENVYLCLISYAGYFFFFWQKPRIWPSGSLIYQFGIYALAVTCTILFWSTLSMTASNLFKSQWAGIGISIVLWLTEYSAFGKEVLGRFGIFAYVFRDVGDIGDLSWLLGKLLGVLSAAAMIAITPYILKKRG